MNIHIIGVTEWEERERDQKSIWRNMPENFPDLKKETDIQVQEAHCPKQDEPKEIYTKKFHN